MDLELIRQKAIKLNSHSTVSDISSKTFTAYKIKVPYPYLAMFKRFPIMINNAFGSDFDIDIKANDTIVLVKKA